MEVWFALKLCPCATGEEQASSPIYWAACSLVTQRVIFCVWQMYSALLEWYTRHCCRPWEDSCEQKQPRHLIRVTLPRWQFSSGALEQVERGFCRRPPGRLSSLFILWFAHFQFLIFSSSFNALKYPSMIISPGRIREWCIIQARAFVILRRFFIK